MLQFEIETHSHIYIIHYLFYKVKLFELILSNFFIYIYINFINLWYTKKKKNGGVNYVRKMRMEKILWRTAQGIRANPLKRGKWLQEHREADLIQKAEN